MQVLVIAAILGVAYGASTPAPVECMSDADCMENQCCYKKHDDLMVSKRGETFEGYPVHPTQDLEHTKGVCQGYLSEGDSCNRLDKQNGYCSCNDKAGFSCELADTDGDHIYFMAPRTCQKGLMVS